MCLTFLLMCLSKCLPKQDRFPVVFAESSPLTTCFIFGFYNLTNKKFQNSVSCTQVYPSATAIITWGY